MKRREGFLQRPGMNRGCVVAGVLLAGYVVFLLTANYFSQLELRETALTRLSQDMEKRAMAVSYFFSERKNDLLDLATRRQLALYFENKALGMSREYGLEAGLFEMEEGFRRLVDRKRLGENRIYSRIVFIDSHGEPLADYEVKGAQRDRERSLKELPAPRSSEPSVFAEPASEGLRVMVSVPYFLKGEYKGRLVAWILPQAVTEQLLDVLDRHDSRRFFGMIDGDSHLFLPARKELAPCDLSDQADGPRLFSCVREDGASEEMLSVRVPVRDTPFSLVTVLPASEVFGHAVPWHLLVAMGFLAVIILGGTAMLLRILSRSNELLMREVDERKRTEAALRQSEARYRTIFETTGTAMVVVGEDTIISLANTKLEELSGCKRAQVEGTKSWQDFFRQEDLERMKSYHHLRRIDPDAAPSSYEAGFVDRHGREKDVLICVAMIPETRESVASLLDISERKRVEAALRMSEARFRTLVESSLTGICILQDGQIIYHNPEQERLLGTAVVDGWCRDFQNVHAEDREKVRQTIERMACGETLTVDMDFRFHPASNPEEGSGVRWAACRANLIEYHGKEAMLINMTDITRIKELEHLLRIEDRMSSLGRVAAGIAHELRNPLSGLNIYVTNLERTLHDLLGDEPDTIRKVEGLLGSIKSTSNRVERVVKRVIDFAKPSVPRLAPADLNRLIEGAISLCAVTLRKSGISLDKSLAPDLPKCYADLQLIDQVLLNLITNAVQVLKDFDGPKKMEITSSAVNGGILIRVADSGPGVPLHLRERIFDPFYTTQKDGAGIGLSLCHRIISDHRGFLRVSTSKWGGAEIAIEIPAGKRRRT